MNSYDYDEQVTLLWVEPGREGSTEKKECTLAEAIRTVANEWEGETRQLSAVVLRDGTALRSRAEITNIYKRSDFPKG